MNRWVRRYALLIGLLLLTPRIWALSALVFQSDFGTQDGAVASMKGVAFSVSPKLRMFDLTHEIPAYNIWEAGYRLWQTAPYWPQGTVFVSVVDPGVGTDRRSVVMKSKTGHFFVTPDNGTLTLVAEHMGIEEVREIDETRNRRSGSQDSYTFHGRDVYALTGARLASGKMSFKDVGKRTDLDVERIPYQKPSWDGSSLWGTIPILDVQYGNVWTNIEKALFERSGIRKGDLLRVTLFRGEESVAQVMMPFVDTFGDVPEGEPLAYINSLLSLSFALNMGSFAEVHHIASGPEWRVKAEKVK